jgi:hypothetical protein
MYIYIYIYELSIILSYIKLINYDIIIKNCKMQFLKCIFNSKLHIYINMHRRNLEIYWRGGGKKYNYISNKKGVRS